jgi:hypothetical protein
LFSLYFRYYTQTFFVITRLIINKINKVQWVDFKLENVLVSLHSLKTVGIGSIIFKEWRVTWTFSYTNDHEFERKAVVDIANFALYNEKDCRFSYGFCERSPYVSIQDTVEV